MPSTWIVTRTTKYGDRRYRVEYRLGGREAPTQYGGSFRTRREADERKRWIGGEIAARRVPELRSLETVERAPTSMRRVRGGSRAASTWPTRHGCGTGSSSRGSAAYSAAAG